jgi:signal peptidase
MAGSDVKVLVRPVVTVFALGLLVMVLGAAWTWHDGYRLYAVRTGSMTPTFPTGALVVAAPLGGPVVPGDVVVFRSGGTGLTTHRVVTVSGDLLQTKGDANETPDVGAVPQSAVIGRVVAGTPRLGYVVVFLQQPPGVASVMTMLLCLMLLRSMFFATPHPTMGRHRAVEPLVH